MDLNEAEKMIYAWGMWERGRSDGIALAIEKVENLLCQQDVSGQQRTTTSARPQEAEHEAEPGCDHDCSDC